MKKMLTLIFCLFLTVGAYAEDTIPAPKEYKSLIEQHETVNQLRELKNCTITYYNIGVYAVLGGSIIHLIEGDEATREKFTMIANRANQQHFLLQKKLDNLIAMLINANYHPMEVRMILDQATNVTLGVITKMIQDVMIDPSRANKMITIMMGSTNKCDKEFLLQ